ncbi:hypothetical protein C349_04255 [Cryptococcus neoformans var. grubii Br795]|nr:hypothetical protein C349_04255 [Cryptococcus neoformans var. grubii Br795]
MVPSSLLNPDTAAINSNKVTMVNNPCTPLSLCTSKTEEPVPGLVRPLVFVLVFVLVCSVSTFVFSAKRQRQRKSNHDIVLCAAKRQDIEKGSSKLFGRSTHVQRVRDLVESWLIHVPASRCCTV